MNLFLTKNVKYEEQQRYNTIANSLAFVMSNQHMKIPFHWLYNSLNLISRINIIYKCLWYRSPSLFSDLHSQNSILSRSFSVWSNPTLTLVCWHIVQVLLNGINDKDFCN